MPFSNLIGNDLAKRALMQMAEQNNIPHALIFSGPDGVGKSQFAHAFASLLLGNTKTDLHIYRPEGKSQTHPVDNIRKLIEEVALPPFVAPAKVFLIYDAEKMLPSSSNALLKTFEEPTPNTYFILLTPALDSLLPTIVSRCRKIPFFSIPQLQIAEFAQKKWNKTPEEAKRIAFLAHGSMGKAEQIATQANERPRELLKQLFSTTQYSHRLHLCSELEDACALSEEEEISADLLFEEIATWYRDLHLLKNGAGTEFLYHLDAVDLLKKSLESPLPQLEKVLDQIGIARLALQRNIKLRNVLEHFFSSLHG